LWFPYAIGTVQSFYFETLVPVSNPAYPHIRGKQMIVPVSFTTAVIIMLIGTLIFYGIVQAIDSKKTKRLERWLLYLTIPLLITFSILVILHIIEWFSA
jgi:uncharacterized membrane protein YidH (DUF202 family)